MEKSECRISGILETFHKMDARCGRGASVVGSRGWAGVVSRCRAETGQVLTGHPRRHGETGVGPPRGLKGSAPGSPARSPQGSYEDHVTHSSAAQRGGLLL